jgi:threonine dehydrogenase-like Zn-dependent dehydrogenase
MGDTRTASASSEKSLMRAVVVTEGTIRVEERPVPVPPPGEALLRLRMAGICNTDLEIVKGYMAFQGVPGHEFVADVVEVHAPAEEARRWLGRRVVGAINCSCGECAFCLSEALGGGRHCPRRTVLGILGRDGALAEYLTLPLRNLHEVPAAMDDRTAVFAEPVAAACAIVEQVPALEHCRAVVVGDGKLGLLIAMVLRHHVPELLVVGRHREKLRLLETLDIATRVDGTTGDRSYDLVVEATGSPSGLKTALSHLRPRGTLVLKSTYHGPITRDLSPLVVDEITLLGSRCGRMEPALERLTDGRVRPAGLIAAQYPLRFAAEAFNHARQPGILKLLLVPGSDS